MINRRVAFGLIYLSNPIFLLILFVLLCHGLLLLNGGVYVDGWVFYGLYLNHNFALFHAIFNQIGIPFLGYFNSAFWVTSNPIFTNG